jgi:predicted PurR-regulated permease PerM
VARIISFVVLMAILTVLTVVFFQVMVDFILPLFLALLLAIMFGPVHRWFQVRCRGRNRWAAFLTTLFILVIILGPTFFLIYRAGSEARLIYKNLTATAERAEASESNQPPEGAPPGRHPNALFHSFYQRVAELSDQCGLNFTPQEVETAVRSRLEEFLTPLALRTGRFLGRTLLGLIVMIVALYYFFADGPLMIHTLLRISPLDEKYEEELLDRFVNVTRAVVVAQLLAAFVQGILAGIGFYIAGLEAVFLLMVLTMLFALIPFIGAATVWGSAALWLIFVEQHTLAGILLALYGASIVSTIDNVIKPWVLHGRSNLHPLLALLSVLGGVKAMGPIGIFVGPMAVAFLQTLLNMISTELTAFSGDAPMKKE